jgi:hypothetical protein
VKAENESSRRRSGSSFFASGGLYVLPSHSDDFRQLKSAGTRKMFNVLQPFLPLLCCYGFLGGSQDCYPPLFLTSADDI